MSPQIPRKLVEILFAQYRNFYIFVMLKCATWVYPPPRFSNTLLTTRLHESVLCTIKNRIEYELAVFLLGNG